MPEREFCVPEISGRNFSKGHQYSVEPGKLARVTWKAVVGFFPFDHCHSMNSLIPLKFNLFKTLKVVIFIIALQSQSIMVKTVNLSQMRVFTRLTDNFGHHVFHNLKITSKRRDNFRWPYSCLKWFLNTSYQIRLMMYILKNQKHEQKNYRNERHKIWVFFSPFSHVPKGNFFSIFWELFFILKNG